MGELWEDPTNPDLLIKKFKKPQSSHESNLLIELNNLLYSIRPSAKETIKQNFAWPLDLYGTPLSITAIKIPRAPEAFYQEIKIMSDTKNMLMTLQYLVDKDWWQSEVVESDEPAISIDGRIEICHHLLTTLLALWESGGVYGDFSYMNLIWALEPTPRIMFLDADTATADNSYDRQVHSPGWREHILPGLTPLQKDFRLASLAIWRILAQKLRAYPDDQNLTNSLNHVDSEVRIAIQDLWTERDMQSAQKLHSTLHKYRDDRFIKLLLKNAINDGLARHALLQMPHKSSRAESDFIDKASKWLLNETKYETKRGTSRTRYGRLLYQINEGLILDVVDAPISVDFSKPESLVDAFRDGDFALIAENFDQFNASSAHIQFVKRAVEHALVEESIPSVAYLESNNSCQVSWTFPANANWISDAIMTVLDANGSVLSEKVFHKKSTLTSVKFEQNQQVSSISIGWRAVNSSNVQVDSPNSWTTKVSLTKLLRQSTQSISKTAINPGSVRPKIILEPQRTFSRDLREVQAVPPKPATNTEPKTRNQLPLALPDEPKRVSFFAKIISKFFSR